MKNKTKDFVIGCIAFVFALATIVLGVIFYPELLKLRIKMDTAILNWIGK